MGDIRYKRVLLKISGESLCREGGSGLDRDAALSIARQCQAVNGNDTPSETWNQ